MLFKLSVRSLPGPSSHPRSRSHPEPITKGMSVWGIARGMSVWALSLGQPQAGLLGQCPAPAGLCGLKRAPSGAAPGCVEPPHPAIAPRFGWVPQEKSSSDVPLRTPLPFPPLGRGASSRGGSRGPLRGRTTGPQPAGAGDTASEPAVPSPRRARSPSGQPSPLSPRSGSALPDAPVLLGAQQDQSGEKPGEKFHLSAGR